MVGACSYTCHRQTSASAQDPGCAMLGEPCQASLHLKIWSAADGKVGYPLVVQTDHTKWTF